MALSTPVALTAVATGAASTLVSASYTPTANGIQVAFISATGSVNGQTLNSVSSTHAGQGAWTIVKFTPASSSQCCAAIAYSVTGASPGSGTFTATFAAAGTDNELFIGETTGQDTTTPVDTAASTSAGAATTSTTPVLTLGAAPATGDITFVTFAGRNIGAAPSVPSATGTFTSLASNNHASPCAAMMGSYRLSSTSTGITPAGMGTISNAGAAIVVKVASGTAVNMSGVVANINLAAPAGTVSAPANLAGPVANIALGAPAGTVSAPKNMVGPVAAITLAAPAGTVSAPCNLAGPVANITFGAPAGTVSAGSTTPYTASGVVAGITLAAPAGTVSAPKNLAGPTAGITLSAPAGTVTAGANLSGTAATLGLAALAGSVTITGQAIHFSSPAKHGGLSDPTDVWWRHTTYTRTLSILKFGSIYQEVEGPSNEQIEAADITYLGGHEYVVDSTEAAALTAAGYGAGLS